MSAPAAVRILAPAKVNLWLRVLHRRADGFHELDTLFQAVDLCDEVEVVRRAGSGVELTVEGAELGPPAENLAHRAARAFLEAVGAGAGPTGVGIRLRKRIPAGAGLGGGSSDAAAVLRCLDALWGRPLAPVEMVAIGASLGSDVPFFLGEAPLARGTGRGDLVSSLPPLPAANLVLVLPPVHVATGPAYGALSRRRAEDSGRDPAPAAPRVATSWGAVAAAAVNDFEQVVPQAHPPVAASLAALRKAGARPALLSGSGGACFGFFPGVDEARAAGEELAALLGWPAIPVRTLTAFPGPQPG